MSEKRSPLLSAEASTMGVEMGTKKKLAVGAWDGVNVELMRLDHHSLLEMQVIRQVVHDKGEALHEVDEHDLDFLPGERATLCTRIES